MICYFSCFFENSSYASFAIIPDCVAYFCIELFSTPPTQDRNISNPVDEARLVLTWQDTTTRDERWNIIKNCAITIELIRARHCTDENALYIVRHARQKNKKLLYREEHSASVVLSWCTLWHFLGENLFAFYGWLYVKFSLATGGCFTIKSSLGWSPANITISDIPLKTRFFGLHFTRRMCRWSSTTFT